MGTAVLEFLRASHAAAPSKVAASPPPDLMAALASAKRSTSLGNAIRAQGASHAKMVNPAQKRTFWVLREKRGESKE